METLRYLSGVSTIQHDLELCKGCRSCEQVCPHGVFAMNGKKSHLVDRDGCMECGACVLNCQSGAISVTPGVGCAAYIISGWFRGKENASCGGPDCC